MNGVIRQELQNDVQQKINGRELIVIREDKFKKLKKQQRDHLKTVKHFLSDKKKQDRHIMLQQEYINLLESECKEAGALAAFRGWESSRVLQGEELRRKLSEYDRMED